jgi:hypothetical protein
MENEEFKIVDDYNDLYDYLVDNEIFTEEEIAIAVYFNGESIETLETLLYYRTGYRSLDQILEEE